MLCLMNGVILADTDYFLAPRTHQTRVNLTQANSGQVSDQQWLNVEDIRQFGRRKPLTRQKTKDKLKRYDYLTWLDRETLIKDGQVSQQWLLHLQSLKEMQNSGKNVAVITTVGVQPDQEMVHLVNQMGIPVILIISDDFYQGNLNKLIHHRIPQAEAIYVSDDLVAHRDETGRIITQSGGYGSEYLAFNNLFDQLQIEPGVIHERFDPARFAVKTEKRLPYGLAEAGSLSIQEFEKFRVSRNAGPINGHQFNIEKLIQRFPPVLEYTGLNRRMFLSKRNFKLEHRPFQVAYIENDTGEFVARLFYLSGSHGVWRNLPNVQVEKLRVKGDSDNLDILVSEWVQTQEVNQSRKIRSEEERIKLFDKGFGEASLNACWQLQEIFNLLGNNSPEYTEVFDEKNWQAQALLASISGTQDQEIAMKQAMEGRERMRDEGLQTFLYNYEAPDYSKKRGARYSQDEVSDPEDVKHDVGQMTEVLRQFKAYSDVIGEYENYIVETEKGYVLHFGVTKNNEIWLISSENQINYINEYGARMPRPYDFRYYRNLPPALPDLYALYEYTVQIPIKFRSGKISKNYPQYMNTWNYLQWVPLIQQFHDQILNGQKQLPQPDRVESETVTEAVSDLSIFEYEFYIQKGIGSFPEGQQDLWRGLYAGRRKLISDIKKMVLEDGKLLWPLRNRFNYEGITLAYAAGIGLIELDASKNRLENLAYFQVKRSGFNRVQVYQQPNPFYVDAEKLPVLMGEFYVGAKGYGSGEVFEMSDAEMEEMAVYHRAGLVRWEGDRTAGTIGLGYPVYPFEGGDLKALAWERLNLSYADSENLKAHLQRIREELFAAIAASLKEADLLKVVQSEAGTQNSVYGFRSERRSERLLGVFRSGELLPDKAKKIYELVKAIDGNLLVKSEGSTIGYFEVGSSTVTENPIRPSELQVLVQEGNLKKWVTDRVTLYANGNSQSDAISSEGFVAVDADVGQMKRQMTHARSLLLEKVRDQLVEGLRVGSFKAAAGGIHVQGPEGSQKLEADLTYQRKGNIFQFFLAEQFIGSIEVPPALVAFRGDYLGDERAKNRLQYGVSV